MPPDIPLLILSLATLIGSNSIEEPIIIQRAPHEWAESADHGQIADRLSEYDAGAAPEENVTIGVHLSFDSAILNQDLLTALMVMEEHWLDKRLASAVRSDRTYIRTPASLWLPDTLIVNALDSTVTNLHLELSRDGGVIRKTRRKTVVRCEEYAPSDGNKANCTIILGSFANRAASVINYELLSLNEHGEFSGTRHLLAATHEVVESQDFLNRTLIRLHINFEMEQRPMDNPIAKFVHHLESL